jgi:hypothetical protein
VLRVEEAQDSIAGVRFAVGDERDGDRAGMRNGDAHPDSDPDPERKREPSEPSEPSLKQPPPPLRLLPILPPPSLRAAQTESSALVRDLVPRLAQVEVEMREVEVCVRRARKRQAKATGK